MAFPATMGPGHSRGLALVLTMCPTAANNGDSQSPGVGTNLRERRRLDDLWGMRTFLIARPPRKRTPSFGALGGCLKQSQRRDGSFDWAVAMCRGVGGLAQSA
jgi:hypothetical protein